MENMEFSGVEKRKAEVMWELQKFQERFDVWGHGVSSVEVADSILRDELKTRWGALHDFSYKLSINPEVLSKQLEGWNYQGRTIIILIAAPKGTDFTDFGGYDARQKSVELSKKHIFIDRSDSGENLVPSSGIIGYLDLLTFHSKKNINFDQGE